MNNNNIIIITTLFPKLSHQNDKITKMVKLQKITPIYKHIEKSNKLIQEA